MQEWYITNGLGRDEIERDIKKKERMKRDNRENEEKREERIAGADKLNFAPEAKKRTKRKKRMKKKEIIIKMIDIVERRCKRKEAVIL